jgi:rhodanese-related sulfurtransferase
MAEGPKITAGELKRRMQAGEDFTVIDVRNPTAWAESDVNARNAIRVPFDSFERYLPRIPKSKPIVTYCT